MEEQKNNKDNDRTIVKLPMRCSDFCVDGANVFFAHKDMNAVYRFNLSTNEMSFVTRIPNEKEMQEYMFSRILKYDNLLLFIPFRADCLSIYDINTNKFVYQKNMREYCEAAFVFSDAYLFQNIVYCIPYLIGQPVICFDLENFQLNRIESAPFERYLGKYINHCCGSNSNIYCAIPDLSEILVLNTLTNEWDSIALEAGEGACGLATDGDSLFIQFGKAKKLVVWSLRTNSLSKTIYHHSDSGQICMMNSKHLWIDSSGENANIIDFSQGNVISFCKEDDVNSEKHVDNCSGPAHLAEQGFFYFNEAISHLMCTDGENWKSFELTIELVKDSIYRERIMKENSPLLENICYCLLDYIRAI